MATFDPSDKTTNRALESYDLALNAGSAEKYLSNYVVKRRGSRRPPPFLVRLRALMAPYIDWRSPDTKRAERPVTAVTLADWEAFIGRAAGPAARDRRSAAIRRRGSDRPTWSPSPRSDPAPSLRGARLILRSV